MASYNANLADITARIDPDGKFASIGELVSETNEGLEYVQWVEGNLPTGHQTTVRTGLPTIAWRKLNYGVQPSKSTVAKVMDTCGMLEGYSEHDKDVVKLYDVKEEYMASEDRAFLQEFGQQVMDTIFKGNTDTHPERFMGLAPRYDTLPTANTIHDDTRDNVINAGGTGGGSVYTSIWLVVFGPNTIHGIYPKGSKAGLEQEYLGIETIQDSSGYTYRAHRTHYKWDCGLTVRDWRYAVRIPNIALADLNGATPPDLNELMIRATEIPPSLDNGRAVFCMNRYVRTHLRLQRVGGTAGNITYSFNDVTGKKVMEFDGIPIARCDQLDFTEAEVS
jgi:hypothetical protein